MTDDSHNSFGIAPPDAKPAELHYTSSRPAEAEEVQVREVTPRAAPPSPPAAKDMGGGRAVHFAAFKDGEGARVQQMLLENKARAMHSYAAVAPPRSDPTNGLRFSSEPIPATAGGVARVAQ